MKECEYCGNENLNEIEEYEGVYVCKADTPGSGGTASMSQCKNEIYLRSLPYDGYEDC